MPEHADTDRVEELAKRVDDLESQLEDGNKSDGSRPSRRGFLGMLAASAGLGAAGVYGLSGRSSAATAQGYTRTGELRDGNDATLATLNNGGPFAFQVPVTAPEIDVDEIKSIASYIVSSGDDAQSIIEGMNRYEIAYFEPGATFDVTPPLNIPQGVTLFGGPSGRRGDPSVTFEKVADGDMISRSDGVRMHNLIFLGQKSQGYTGSGVVGSTGVQECYWENVVIAKQASHGLVTDGDFFNVYDQCGFNANDGWGVYHASGEWSQSDFRGRTTISNNISGGVRIGANGDFSHVLRFAPVVMANNDGPAIYGSGASASHQLYGLVEGHDGPALLLDETPGGNFAQHRGWQFGGRWLSNTDSVSTSNVDNAGSRTIGTVHVQGNVEVSANWVGGDMGKGTDASVPISDYGGFRTRASFCGGSVRGYSDAVALNGNDGRIVFLNVDRLPSTSEGTNGAAYHYDATGGTSL